MKKLDTVLSSSLALALTVPLLGGCAPEPPSEDDRDEEDLATSASALVGGHMITARHSGLVLGVASASTAGGAAVVQWTSTNVPDQRWKVQNNGDGTYTFVNVNSGQCLDVNGASQADGADIIQWTCKGSANQKWTPEYESEGFYSLKAAHSGKCLDVSALSQSPGAGLQQWSCSGATNQQFRVPLKRLTVNLAAKHQKIEGFGASVAWSNYGLTTHTKKTAIYDALFTDMGLSVLRLRNTHDKGGWEAGDVGLGWDGQIVKAGKDRRGTRLKVLLSSWGPPSSLKAGGAVNGGTLKGTGACDPANPSAYWKSSIDGFAAYWDESLDAYAAQGVYPNYISIQNEPDYEDVWETCRFEETSSCSYPGYGAALAKVAAVVKARPNAPKILGPEVTGIASNNFKNYKTPIAAGLLDGYAYHLYSGGSASQPDTFISALQALAPQVAGKISLQTEFALTDALDKAVSGVAVPLASLIHNVLVEGGANGYLHWEAVWSDRGLIQMPNSTSYTITDKYHAMKHFARYIDPGFTRVDADAASSGLKASAYVSPDGTKLTLVVINPTNTDVFEGLDLGGEIVTGGHSIRTRNSAGENTAVLNAIPLTGGETLAFRAQSVTTVALTLQ